MYGLTEIKQMNRVVADMPQTKREIDYRVQRDRLGQVLRKVLAERGVAAMDVDTTVKADARKVLTEIYGV